MWPAGANITGQEVAITMATTNTIVTMMMLLAANGAQAQNSRIQDLVNQIKNSPRHKSPSPSYTSERKFDVIGVGKLPLQSSSVGTSDIIDRYDIADEVSEKNAVLGKDTAPLPFIDYAPQPVQLTDSLADTHINKGRETLNKRIFNVSSTWCLKVVRMDGLIWHGYMWAHLFDKKYKD